jgi:hypothetical protein
MSGKAWLSVHVCVRAQVSFFQRDVAAALLMQGGYLHKLLELFRVCVCVCLGGSGACCEYC